MDPGRFQPDHRDDRRNGSGLFASPSYQRPRYSDEDSTPDPIRIGLEDSPVSDEIVTDAPAPRFRLTTLDVVCLVLNRMIGSGIFMTPHKVMAQTKSTGVSLLFWFAGVLYALAGMHIYIEYGLNVPRVFFAGKEQSVPRSGGDLNYLQYVYRWFGYRDQTVLPITCLFGIAFIVLGNMAGNCINFSIWIFRAAGRNDVSDGAIRGVALAIATLSCCIHAFSRRGGILLNDVLAVVKVMILLMIIITAIIVAADDNKVFKEADNHFSANMRTEAAFKGASSDAHSYASAFLSIIFAYSGFEQPNYVLGEIGNPRKRFPLGIALGTIISSVLYMVTNIAYMVVVPRCAQISTSSDVSVAEQFFKLTYGNYHVTDEKPECTILAPGTGTTEDLGYRIFSAFVAISSLGNVIVMTYTAARVKQEIAKNGIIPFAKFFAHNSDVSVGHVLKWLQRKTTWFRSVTRFQWLSPEEHMEKTPVGALVLHEISCIILICVTLGLASQDAYTLLVSLATYVIYSFLGMLLGIGILILRIKGPPATSPETKGMTWKEMTGPKINPTLSVMAATYFAFCNAWTLVAYWVPPKEKVVTAGGLAWFAVPTVSWCLVGLGSFWFLGFLAYAKRKEKRVFKVFTVERSFVFESANGHADAEGGKDGGLILAHETVYLAWQAKENMNKESNVRSESPRQWDASY